MAYFIDEDGGLHFLPDDAPDGAEALLPEGAAPIEDADAEAIIAEAVSAEEAAAQREQRIMTLREQLPLLAVDAVLDATKMTALQAARDELADLLADN